MRGGVTSHTRVQPVQAAPHRGTRVYTLWNAPRWLTTLLARPAEEAHETN